MIKCCKNCEYRTVEPNCHMTCKEYIRQVEKANEIAEARRNQYIYVSHSINHKEIANQNYAGGRYFHRDN